MENDIIRKLGFTEEDEVFFRSINDTLAIIGTIIFLTTIAGNLILNRKENLAYIEKFLKSLEME